MFLYMAHALTFESAKGVLECTFEVFKLVLCFSANLFSSSEARVSPSLAFSGKQQRYRRHLCPRV